MARNWLWNDEAVSSERSDRYFNILHVHAESCLNTCQSCVLLWEARDSLSDILDDEDRKAIQQVVKYI